MIMTTLQKLRPLTAFQLVENGPVYIKIRGEVCCPGCGGDRFRLPKTMPVIKYISYIA
jgi:hypothetical protein